MKARAKLIWGKPYLNKERSRFERTAIDPYYSKEGVGYYFAKPLIWNARKKMWIGRYIDVADDAEGDRFGIMRFKDVRFAKWYEKRGLRFLRPLWAEKNKSYREEFVRLGGNTLSEDQINILKQVKFKHGKVSNLDIDDLKWLVANGYVEERGFIFRKHYLADKGNAVLNKILFDEKHKS